jgi:hypothetical protein
MWFTTLTWSLCNDVVFVQPISIVQMNHGRPCGFIGQKRSVAQIGNECLQITKLYFTGLQSGGDSCEQFVLVYVFLYAEIGSVGCQLLRLELAKNGVVGR